MGSETSILSASLADRNAPPAGPAIGGALASSSPQPPTSSAQAPRSASGPQPGRITSYAACFSTTYSPPGKNTGYCTTCHSADWTSAPVCDVYIAGAIELCGPPGANKQVREWLDALSKTRTGKKVVDAVRAAAQGSAVTICFCDIATKNAFITPRFGPIPAFWPWTTSNWSDNDEGLATKLDFDPMYGLRTVTPGPPAKGSNILIQWEFDLLCLAEVSKEDNPGSVMIGHELIHALHLLKGESLINFQQTNACTAKDNMEEARTIGQRSESFLMEPTSENSIRHDLGLELRSNWCGFPDTGAHPSTTSGNDDGSFYQPMPVPFSF